jgi:hypothetical protein
MDQRLRWPALLAIGLALFCPRAEGASTLIFKAVAVDAGTGAGPVGRIYAGPHGVMTLAGRGPRSVTDAAEVARRLNELAEAGLAAERIAVRRERSSYVVVAGDRRIVLVDRTLAKFHNTTPKRLAHMWTDNVSDAFSGPYLSMRPIVVPFGETRSVQLKGNAVGTVTASAETPAVSAAYETRARSVRVLGVAVGRTALVVADERNRLRVPIRCAKWAAQLADPVIASVTGNPPTTEATYQAVYAAVAGSLSLEPGAWASITPWVGEATAPHPGGSAQVPVRVSAAGPDYLRYRNRSVVTVRNESVATEEVDILMVSNSPERLQAHGLWFEGALGEFGSARLLYHHVNGTGDPADLIVELVNLGEAKARVHVVAGKGGPSRDESWAGHRAARDFLRSRLHGVGWVAPVAPGTAAPVLVQRVTPGSTASGVLELRALGPADLRLRCHLAPARSSWLPYPVRSYRPSPILGRWNFQTAREEISAKYEVGRDWAFVTIGDKPLSGTLEGDRLAGSYGVIHDIRLDLSNPTQEVARVEVTLEPGGGAARGTLIVDGQLTEAAMLTQRSESRIALYTMAPGEERTVNIQTMPEGGSSYPVRLVARSL